MRPLGFVELQCVGDAVDDALGDAGGVAAFEADVVLGGDAGEQRDLLAAQPGTRRRSARYTGSPACSGLILARRVAQELPDLAADVAPESRLSSLVPTMSSTLRALPARLGVPASTPLNRVSTCPALAGSVGGAPPMTRCPPRRREPINRRKCTRMTDKKVWFITGAGRGMGVDIAKAALAAGHAVVATGRNPERVSAALGEHDDLLVVKLDVTSPDDAEAAVARRRRPVRPHRRPGQQRRQLLRRVLRGDQPRRTSGRRSRPPCSAR